jgi:hypothetical protein
MKNLGLDVDAMMQQAQQQQGQQGQPPQPPQQPESMQEEPPEIYDQEERIG